MSNRAVVRRGEAVIREVHPLLLRVQTSDGANCDTLFGNPVEIVDFSAVTAWILRVSEMLNRPLDRGAPSPKPYATIKEISQQIFHTQHRRL
jgi:hypothetical protein